MSAYNTDFLDTIVPMSSLLDAYHDLTTWKGRQRSGHTVTEDRAIKSLPTPTATAASKSSDQRVQFRGFVSLQGSKNANTRKRTSEDQKKVQGRTGDGARKVDMERS
jgi:hypothetical protein